MRHSEQYQEMIPRIFEYRRSTSKNEHILPRTITFQVTDACNLCCSYCYQINKGHRKMSFETGKKFIDLLLSGGKGFHDFVSPENSPAVILEFIGGEPFLEIGLINDLVEYFKRRTIELHHPWATMYRISLCSNGVLYFDPEVQRFLKRNKHMISLNVTLDGDKRLHDSCRVFADGSGSYDMAVAAAMDWVKQGNYMGSKITIAPANLPYLYDAIVHMLELGYDEINANCVFEKGWEQHHATSFYYELKRIADYLLSKDISMDDLYLSLFDEDLFHPKSPEDNINWCGSVGFMLACDPDGYLCPCIRFMESSLGGERPPMRIGDLNQGIYCTDEYRCNLDCLKCITRRSQSTDECFNCPIGEGCSWCTAQNYQETGSPNRRTTNICEMHKARALANAYFWNSYYRKNHMPLRFKNNVPDEWALKIIPESELKLISELSSLS